MLVLVCESCLTFYLDRYVLVNAGVGDAVTSYVPEAIKRIGLWDERFSNIGCAPYQKVPCSPAFAAVRSMGAESLVLFDQLMSRDTAYV